MEMEKEYSCIEKNSLVYHKLINADENYQETLESYLDDMIRVIKCTSRNVVTGYEINGNDAVVNGKTIINLTYCNDSGELIYTDFEENFTKSISIDEVSQDAFITAFINDKYTSFRVINQRRIDIISSFSLDVKIYDKSSCPCVSACDKSKLRVQRERLLNVVNSGISRIEFDEELSVPTASQGINRVVSITANAVLGEIKSIKDKFLLKGMMNCCILYSNEANELDKVDYSFEFSKIVEMLGIDTTSEIFVKPCIGNTYAKAKSEIDSGGRIEIFGDIYASIIAMEQIEKEIVTDGYVIGRSSDVEYSTLEICCNGKYVDKTYDKKLELEFPSIINKIVELELTASDAYIKNGRLSLRLTANALNENENNEIECISASQTLEFKAECDNDIAVSASIISMDFNIQNEKTICIRVSLNLKSYVYASKKIRIMSEISCEDERLDFPALSLYFGKAEESLWDIAKSFSSDIELIKRENDIKSEFLDANKVLVIPGL